MRVITCHPKEAPIVEELPFGVKDVLRHVGEEAMPLRFHYEGKPYTLICSKEGVRVNRQKEIKGLYGRFLLCDRAENDEWQSLNEQEAHQLCEVLATNGFSLDQIVYH